MPERTHAWPVYDIFSTVDQQNIFIGVVTEGHWQAFCETYDLQELLADERLKTATDRILARSWTIPLVATKIAQVSTEDLVETLDRLSIPFALINSPEDLFNDPHVLRDGGLVSSKNADGEAFRSPALPLELDGDGLGADLNVPVLGADTEAVLAELEPELIKEEQI